MYQIYIPSIVCTWIRCKVNDKSCSALASCPWNWDLYWQGSLSYLSTAWRRFLFLQVSYA